MYLGRVVLSASSQALELPYSHIKVAASATAAPTTDHSGT